MAFPILPSPSNFLGVALVINRSRDGPRFVFHYPPHIRSPQSRRGKLDGEGDEDGGNGADDDYDDDYDDDTLMERLFQPSKFDDAALNPSSGAAERLRWDQDHHLETDSGTQIVPWEYVAGFPTKDLENILTPARAYHKRLFQVSLDPLHCVSFPIHVPENGVWRKKKKQQQRHKHEDYGPEQEEDEAAAAAASASVSASTSTSTSTLATDMDGVSKPDDAAAALEADGPVEEVKDAAKTGEKAAEEAEDKKSSMTMFNVVFILHPKKNKAKGLVDTLFDHVIREINQAYQYCQQRSDFVWKESKRILALKDKGREERTKMSSLWNEILSTSSLAASMQDLYEAVSQNRIAALQLDTPEGMVAHSFQTPVPFHIYDLPEADEAEQARGLWLTTAYSAYSTHLGGEDGADEPGYLNGNFALLLLDDEKKTVSELQSDTDAAALAMIEFVRHSKPTLSFHQVWQQPSNVLSPTQVRHFVRHFIYWRRAMSVPPLHARDMYVVSPNADMTRLPEAAAHWARQFPMAPALPDFLAELSNAPRPYKLHCPSKAHRPLYMAMLAWLLRDGWVTQLCTFAYVVVWPEIVYEVEYAREAEDLAWARRRAAQSPSPSTSVSQVDGADDTGVGGGGGGGDDSMMASAISALGEASLAGFGFPPLTGSTSSPATTAIPDTGSDLASSTATLRRLPAPLVSLAHPGHPALPHNDTSSVISSSSSSNNHNNNNTRNPLDTPTHASNPWSDHSHDHDHDHANNPFPSPSASFPSSPTYDNNNNNNNNSDHEPSSPRPATPTPAEQAAEQARLERIADKAARELDERQAAHARRARPQQTAHPSANAAPHLAGIAPYIVLDAGKATGKESQFLSAIERRLRAGAKAGNSGGRQEKNGRQQQQQKQQQQEREEEEGKGEGGGSNNDADEDPDPDADADGASRDNRKTRKKDRNIVKPSTNSNNVARSGTGNESTNNTSKSLEERAADAWPRFYKYFNGRSALEHIALQEDMKRKEVWGLLTAMGEYLLCVRHW